MSRDHKLIFKGTSKQLNYVGGGKDGKEDYIVDCHQGDTVYITEEKKAELLRDHPEWFVEANLEPPKPTEPEPEPEAVSPKKPETKDTTPVDYMRPQSPQPIIDYSKYGMKKLREIAKKKGIKVPFGTSKEALIKLIESKK